MERKTKDVRRYGKKRDEEKERGRNKEMKKRDRKIKVQRKMKKKCSSLQGSLSLSRDFTERLMELYGFSMGNHLILISPFFLRDASYKKCRIRKEGVYFRINVDCQNVQQVRAGQRRLDSHKDVGNGRL